MAAAPDFATQRAPSPGSQRIAGLWRWWTGEISRLLPERFGMLHGSGAPLLAVEGDEAVVIDPHVAPGTGEKRAALLSLDDARRRAAIRNLLESVGETRQRARVALRHDEALVRRVTLPAATEENLAQVLAFEMDRLSPFQADEVYFDHRVVSRDAANATILVELALARRAAVDTRVRELRALGVSVQGVALRDDAGRSTMPFDLLPSEQRGERETARERLVRNVLIVAVLALFLATLVLPVWKKRDAVTSLHPVLAKAQQEAQATDAVVRELERQAGDYNFLLTRKHGWFPAAAYVEELSRLLPDNTWLQQMDVKTSGKNKELVITGETASSSKLIELLEQSKLLQNATPRGPTTRGSTPGMERFMIGAELRARTPPEPQPIVGIPAPATAATPAGGPAGAAQPPREVVPPHSPFANTAPPAQAPAPATATVTVPPPAAPPTSAVPAPAPPSSSGFGPPPRRDGK